MFVIITYFLFAESYHPYLHKYISMTKNQVYENWAGI